MAELVYAPWVHDSDPSLAWLDDRMPAELDAVRHKLTFGNSAADDLGDTEIIVDLSPDTGIRLADSIPNIWHLKVVSERLRDVLAEEAAEIEFHPVRVRNLKGRLETDVYYVMNPIGSVDCMNAEESDFEESKVEPGQVRRFRHLVLDTSRIPEDRRIFRLASQKELVLVRRDLAYDIYRVHEHRGMIFQTMESFGEEFR